jgi:HK97 family phage prohead protease
MPLPENAERRYTWAEAPELRVHEEVGKIVVRGYAAVFGSPSQPMPFGTEVVMRGAFAKALRSRQDVVALYNHDADHVLGRRSAGTLKLKEDDYGLSYRAELGDTQLDDFIASRIERRDITGSSFSFTVQREEWDDPDNPRKTKRRILEVDRLFDVGPVTFPAYPATQADVDVAKRSMQAWVKERRANWEQAMERRKRMLRVEEAELDLADRTG